MILAGGLGKRLRERTGNLPKVLAEVDNRALLEHQLLLLQEHGIKKGYLILGYKSECIISFCDELKLDDFVIDYIIEEKPLGTAGSVLLNQDKFRKPFILFYGDTMVSEIFRGFVVGILRKEQACHCFCTRIITRMIPI